jgi:hypothetical protein
MWRKGGFVNSNSNYLPTEYSSLTKISNEIFKIFDIKNISIYFSICYIKLIVISLATYKISSLL